MNNTLKVIALISLIVSNAGYAQDFDKGYKAYESKDYATALREWKPLAEQGVAAAQSNLGMMYDHGQGVTQDDKEAVKWYRLAAEQGFAKAQFNLGFMYENGEGVTQDYKEAVKWSRLAAEQGDVISQFGLGMSYEQGEGVIQDTIYAYMWYNIAASSGNKYAVNLRDHIVDKMTASQLEKAQELARECVKKNYKGC